MAEIETELKSIDDAKLGTNWQVVTTKKKTTASVIATFQTDKKASWAVVRHIATAI